MIKSSLPFFSRLLTFLLFFFAFVSILRGVAPFINNSLYTSHKTFIAWLFISDQGNNNWLFLIFCLTIAGGLLTWGIMRYRKEANTRKIALNQPETTEGATLPSPKRRRWLRISAIIVYLVATCVLCCISSSDLANPMSTVHEGNLYYQGHVYQLSVTPEVGGFNFEVWQCDNSGWFCHFIYHDIRNVTISTGDSSVTPFSSAADLIDAHLQVDAPHQQLLILYHGEYTSDSGKLVCPIP